MLKELCFYFFSTGAVLSAVGVIRSRSAVTSVLWLVLAMGFTAGLFALLGAVLVAAIQVLVYAGAILVLFLFIVMLTNTREPAEDRVSKWGIAAAGAVSLVVLFQILGVGRSIGPPAAGAVAGGPAKLGALLFRDYALPFELTSFLLLAAIVSIVVLAKRDPS